MSKVVLIDNGHGAETPGKRSPDGMLREWAWARECAARIVAELRKEAIDARLLVKETRDVPIAERVRRVNSLCRQLGTADVALVSIHVNAAGADGRWRDARGFLPYVSPNASAASRLLARYLYEEVAEKRGMRGNRWISKEKCAVKSLGMTRDTWCPAVLTENLYMDNREDCRLLLSEEGMAAIVEGHTEAIGRWCHG